MELLLLKLEHGNLFSEVTNSVNSGRNNTASLPSLAAIVGLKYLLESLNMGDFIEMHLPTLLSILLKYLSGWLHVETPASLINTKYGYVPNRAAQKMNPYAEVHSIITNVLMIIQPNIAYSLLVEAVRIKKYCLDDLYAIVLILLCEYEILGIFRDTNRGKRDIDCTNVN